METALSLANIALGVFTLLKSVKALKRPTERRVFPVSRRVMNAFCLCIGAYWAALYAFVVVNGLIFNLPVDSVWFGVAFVRPAMTVTLAYLVVSAGN